MIKSIIPILIFFSLLLGCKSMKVEDVTPVIDNKEKEEIVEKTPEDEIDVERPENYPFSIEERVSATLNVDTSTKEKFKNQLLGYNIEGFKSSTEKDFIRKFNPVSIRFPSGLWSNFYQWQTDGYQNDSWDNKSHEASLDIYAEKIKGNINDIASLNQEKLTNYGKGFHMMWTYSMNFDDAESCVARAEKDEALGFEIKDIELGNEHFWKSQRSNQTKTEYDYLNRASSVANGLHQRFPEVRVSIPLSWRRTHEEYNKVIIGDQQYFDAISLHKYMGADPDVPGESNSAYSALLTSREVLEEDVLWIRSLAGDKPIWMTEWGVSANSDVEVNSGACLGMADVYLYMAENQNVFDRANWFIFNKALNPMVVVDDRRKPVYPLQKRGYLSVLEIFNEVFMDADIIASSITSTKLNETMNAVNAVMVDKEGKQKIIAVNLSYKTALFKVLFDNQERVQSYKHQALVFEELGPVANIGIDEDPKVLINEEAKNLELPPLSISIIELNN